MRTLSCFFILIFVAGVISCTGDDETITINTKQCYNGTTVNITEGEECPTPPPPTMGNGDTSGGDTSGGDAGGGDDGSTGGECNLNATGKAPFNGSSGDDVICGDGDNNTINALGGEDIVRAKGGNDIVDGGSGNDELYGEAGNDILTGGEDEDVIDGGPGNDTLTGSEGRDKLIGGEGSDTVNYVGTVGEKPLVKEDGTLGVSGTDYEPYDLVINLADGYSNDEYGDQDTYVGIENVTTGPGDDTITGDGNANILTGGAGIDTIKGGGGNDVISGGAGDDTLEGEAGNDTIDPGDDQSDGTINGGEGIDTLIVGAGETTWAGETNSNDGFENMRVREGVTTTATLTGDEGPNVLTGGGGNDILTGGPGRDTLIGGPGNDCFVFDAADPVTVDNTLRDFDGDRVCVDNVPATYEVIAGSSSVVIACVDAEDDQGDTGSDGKCDSDDTTSVSSTRTTIANINNLRSNNDAVNGGGEGACPSACPAIPQ